MTTRTKVILLLGVAAIFVGGGLGFAQEPPASARNGGPMGLMALMARDGKVTHAALEAALASRFAQLSGGARAITPAEFALAHRSGMAGHAPEMFARLDWNGDGKISLQEFTAVEHSRFAMMDRAGTGTIPCHVADKAPSQDAHRAGWMHHGHGMVARHFCAENDLNKDGKVTRAEFDSAIAKRFAALSGGGHGITEEALAAEMARRTSKMSAAIFKRLDANGDGKLTLAEFSAPEEAMFAHLDANGDGVITRDELRARFHGLHGAWRGAQGGGQAPD